MVRFRAPFGSEDKFPSRLPVKIEQAREIKPIRNDDRAGRNYPNRPNLLRGEEKGHPAKRIFQAIRIAGVNDELGAADESFNDHLTLAVGGRISVITFHSLEDRLTKQLFKSLNRRCSQGTAFHSDDLQPKLELTSQTHFTKQRRIRSQ